MFRCLALHRGADVEALERVSQELKAKLEEFTGKNFDVGVLMEDLPKVEDLKFNMQKTLDIVNTVI